MGWGLSEAFRIFYLDSMVHQVTGAAGELRLEG